LAKVVGQLMLKNIPTFFIFGSAVDSEEPSLNIGAMDQISLGLPYPSLYFDNDNESISIRQEYQQHIYRLSKLLTCHTQNFNSSLAFEVEKKIANFTVPPDLLIDPFATFNKMTVQQFITKYSQVNWAPFFSEVNVATNKNITLSVPSYFGNLTLLLSTLDTPSLESYLTLRVIHKYASYLSNP